MTVILSNERLTRLRAKMDRLALLEAAAEYEGSLYRFVQGAWPSIENTPFQESWVIEGMCDHLEALTWGYIPRLLINVPPRCAKTSVVSILYPTWVWIQTQITYLSGPQVKFLCASYNHNLATGSASKSRQLMASPWFQLHWPNKIVLRDDENTKIKYDNTRGGSRMSISVGGSLLGTGGDCLIADDLNKVAKDNDVGETSAERQKVADFWSEFHSTRLNDPKRSAIIAVQQRIHQQDNSGLILDSDEDWVHYCVPMRHETTRHCITVKLPQYEGDEPWEDPRSEEGELMWPERFGEPEVSKLEAALGPYMASGRLQQRPFPKGGGIIQRAWWQPWDHIEAQKYGLEWTASRKEFPPFELVVGSLDTSYGEKQQNDFNALTIWGLWLDRNRNRRAMLMYAWAKRLPLHGTAVAAKQGEAKVNLRQRQEQAWGLVELVADSCRRYKVQRLLIEDRTRGRDVANEIRRQYARDNWGVELLQPVGDKESRTHSIVPLFTDGAIWAPDTKWSDAVITQCVVAGTKIITRDGVLPIEEVKVGNYVLTHKGRFRPVLSVSRSQAQQLIRLEPKSLDPITLTPEHPVFALDLKCDRAPVSGPSWVFAGETKAREYRTTVREGRSVTEAHPSRCHAMTLPVVQRENPIKEIDLRDWATLPGGKKYDFLHDEESFTSSHSACQSVKWGQKLDRQFGRVVGLYLAEGSGGRRGTVSWSFHAEEMEFIKEITEFVEQRLGCGTYLQRGSNCTTVRACLPLIESFFHDCGILAENKRVPGWIWNAPNEFLEGVLYGYVDGDGSYRKNGIIEANTVSPSLAWGVRLLALRLGIYATVYLAREAGETSINGRKFKTLKTYRVSWRSDRQNKGCAFKYDDVVAYSLMKKSDILPGAEVFNLAVAEDHSYCTTGGLVHNCERFPKDDHDDLHDSMTQFLNWARARDLLVMTDEASAALEDHMKLVHKQESVAQHYGV